MPQTHRCDRVEVYTTGPLTLDEIRRFCDDAHRAGIPTTTLCALGGVFGAGTVLKVAHDYRQAADAPTQVLHLPDTRATA